MSTTKFINGRCVKCAYKIANGTPKVCPCCARRVG